MLKIHLEKNMVAANLNMGSPKSRETFSGEKSYIFSFTGRSYYSFGYFAYNEKYGIQKGQAA
jgi:hypothetical protein